MSYLKIDLHNHTSASFDCNDDIVTKLKRAEQLGLDIIAITDHNEISNALKALEVIYKLQLKTKVIVGEEISTDRGEVIGLFLKKYIKPGKLKNVIDDIKSQNGMVYLPHPFKRSEIIKTDFIKDVDIIEIWNARSSYEQNYKALIFAIMHNKLLACGSDSHLISELGRCQMIIDTDIDIFNECEIDKDTFVKILDNSKKMQIIGTNKDFLKLEFKSQVIKCLKKKTIKPFKYLFFYLLNTIIYDKSSCNNFNILIKKGETRY